jgi:hypothetical protein
METVPSNATAKQLKHPNHSDSGGNTWQSNKFGYSDIYALMADGNWIVPKKFIVKLSNVAPFIIAFLVFKCQN